MRASEAAMLRLKLEADGSILCIRSSKAKAHVKGAKVIRVFKAEPDYLSVWISIAPQAETDLEVLRYLNYWVS